MMKNFPTQTVSPHCNKFFSPFGSKRACSNSGMMKSLSDIDISDRIEGEILCIQTLNFANAGSLNHKHVFFIYMAFIVKTICNYSR
jgi:hypothetical protein